MNRFPTRFARSPLTEAVFEMRFAAAPGRGVELLPGVMLATLGGAFPRIEQMPLGTLPKEIREKTPELQHAAVFKLQATTKPCCWAIAWFPSTPQDRIQVGRSFGVARCRSPWR